MHIVKIEETFQNSINEVWDLITNLDNQLWRSDIERIEVVDDNHFIEYDKSGYRTEFTITCKVMNEVYEFDIKNDNIEGHWIGKFKVLENQLVHIELIESIEVKKMVMNLMAKPYIRKQQKSYIQDLKKALQR
ncbi:MAG: polyketide cyclase [Coprobacillus sp.]